MIEILGVVHKSEIPPQNRAGSGNRNGLHKTIRAIVADLPPRGQFVKIRHDYPYSSMVTARIQNTLDKHDLPRLQVIVRGHFAFIGRRTTK